MRTIFVVVAAALMAALVGCGGSETTENEGASASAAPAAEPASPQNVDLSGGMPALAVSAEALDAGWVDAGYHPTANILSTKNWGSYSSEGDAATGVAKVTFAPPEGTSKVAIPVALGPGLKNVGLKVVDPATGAALASIVPGEDYVTWKVWSVELPPGLASVEIHGEDTGKEWGEWIAFGAPFAF